MEATVWARQIPRYRATYERTAKRRGNKIGRSVVARRLLRSIYKVLRAGVAFEGFHAAGDDVVPEGALQERWLAMLDLDDPRRDDKSGKEDSDQRARATPPAHSIEPCAADSPIAADVEDGQREHGGELHAEDDGAFR